MSEERKGTPCPLCSEGNLKVNDSMIYCENRKMKPSGRDFYNEGTCDFHLFFKNKLFGKSLSISDVKRLLKGESIRNAKGDTLTLDLDNDFFTRIDFAEKKEDKFL